MIGVIDYGAGNLGSLVNMLRHIGVESQILTHPEQLQTASKLILPGVGHFATAMNKLESSGLKASLLDAVACNKTPLLGVCLGMQLLMDRSEEGNCRGLGFVSGEVRRFPYSEKLKVPHMGWNVANVAHPSNLTCHMHDEQRFYFVHSFYVRAANRQNAILTTDYGIEFDSGVQNENVYGVQFHPEKSHSFGMRLFKQFAEMPC